MKKVTEIIKNVDTQILMDKPASAWREVLAKEVHVYVFGEIYIAKRFDQIHYVFCDRTKIAIHLIAIFKSNKICNF